MRLKQRADNGLDRQRVRHDYVGPRAEPDATARALRVFVLSVLVGGKPMTATEIWRAIGAPDDARALLPLVLDDLVERGEVEARRCRLTPCSAFLTTRYSLPVEQQ